LRQRSPVTIMTNRLRTEATDQRGGWAIGGQPLTTVAVHALAHGEASLPV